MARVGFILKQGSAEPAQLLDQLIPWLVGAGHAPVFVAEDAIARRDATMVPEASLAAAIDIAVVLGGDGTMLRAAGLVADAGVPVLGINLGRLGFLTPFDPEEALPTLQAALGGKLEHRERMRLAVQYMPRGQTTPVKVAAVNDVVVHQGAMARLVELEVRINDQFIAQYRADGLILSTPTGSTAYNLAAGGPILTPNQQAMVLTPICAHTLTNRPLVLGTGESVTVRVGEQSRGVVITVDGLWAHTFEPGDRVDVIAGARPLIAFESDKPYFEILRDKLHWAAPAIGRQRSRAGSS